MMTNEEPELKFYRIIGADGFVQFRAVPAKAMPPRWDRSGPRPIRVPRMPEAFEDWDEATSQFVLNTSAQADSIAGPGHIARAHTMKAIEALLMSAGYNIDGLIVAEAKLLNIETQDLVDTILAKTQKMTTIELARRQAKKGA